jgi:hypothetical protein
LLQAPQLLRSVCRLRQAPLQALRPPLHCVVHDPPLHTSFTLQATGQDPQWLGFDDVSAQKPLQSVCPCEHWQVPWQVLPPVQADPHPPQLAESVLRSTHVPPQGVLPCGH